MGSDWQESGREGPAPAASEQEKVGCRGHREGLGTAEEQAGAGRSHSLVPGRSAQQQHRGAAWAAGQRAGLSRGRQPLAPPPTHPGNWALLCERDHALIHAPHPLQGIPPSEVQDLRRPAAEVHTRPLILKWSRYNAKKDS